MEIQRSVIKPSLSACLYDAIQEHQSKQIFFSIEKTENFQSQDMMKKAVWESWITTLQSKQNQNTLKGVAYQIGQSFFFTFLYAFDDELKFSELSFKLQSFEQKQNYFFSSFANLLRERNINSSWVVEESSLKISIQTRFPEILEWFLKGVFVESLFWLSNGKHNQVKIDHLSNAQDFIFQIKMI